MDYEFVSRMEKDGHRILPLGWRDFLDSSITEEELKIAVIKGACDKVSWRDGTCLEIFKFNYDIRRVDDGTSSVMYADLTHSPLRILSVHFTAAFNRISHTYLLRMLKSYGYSRKFITLIQKMNMLDCTNYQEITILVVRITSTVAG